MGSTSVQSVNSVRRKFRSLRSASLFLNPYNISTMKHSIVKAFRMHLLVIGCIILGATIAAPNEQGAWAAIMSIAAYGLLWCVLPSPKPVVIITKWNHDEEPFVDHSGDIAALIETAEEGNKHVYQLMHQSLEKEAFLRQCGTLN